MTKLTRLGSAAVLLTFAIAFGTSDAYAHAVQISGTHTKAEIKSKCDALADGVPVTGQDGHGYGCMNTKKGTSVACNDAGQCTGFTPG